MASISHSKIFLYLRLAQSLVLMLSSTFKTRHGELKILVVNYSIRMSMPHSIIDKASCGTIHRCSPVQWQLPELLLRPSNALLLKWDISSPVSATCCAETSIPSALGTLRSGAERCTPTQQAGNRNEWSRLKSRKISTWAVLLLNFNVGRLYVNMCNISYIWYLWKCKLRAKMFNNKSKCSFFIIHFSFNLNLETWHLSFCTKCQRLVFHSVFWTWTEYLHL